jgi:hypothetical protein
VRAISAFVVVLLAAPALGRAAQVEGAYLTSPFTLSATRETKFIVDGRELSDNVVLFAPPTLSLLKLSARGEVSLSYQPELQAFGTYHELTSVNHDAELLVSQELSPRVTFGLGDTFVSTADPSRRVVDSVLLLPRERLTENVFYAELGRRFGATTTLTLRYDNTFTRLGDRATSRTGLIDRVANTGSLSLAQRVSRRHLLTATYLYLDARPLTQTTTRRTPAGIVILPLEPENAHSGALSYIYDGDTFSLRMAGGLLAGRDVTYTGSAQLDKRFGRNTVSLIAQRNISLFGGVVPTGDARFGSGVFPFALYESAIARLRLGLTRTFWVQLQGIAQRTFTDLTALDVRSDFARFRLEYQPTRTLTLYGAAEMYRQSFNEFVGLPLDWQRYGVGLELATSSKPNPLEERRRRRDERERRVRRGEPLEEDDDGAATATRGVSADSR